MKEYIVDVPEVWIQRVKILAENADEARKLVQDGNGDYLDNELEYSHTFEHDEYPWRVGE